MGRKQKDRGRGASCLREGQDSARAAASFDDARADVSFMTCICSSGLSA